MAMVFHEEIRWSQFPWWIEAWGTWGIEFPISVPVARKPLLLLLRTPGKNEPLAHGLLPRKRGGEFAKEVC